MSAEQEPTTFTPGGNPTCPKCGRWYGPGETHVCPDPAITEDVWHAWHGDTPAPRHCRACGNPTTADAPCPKCGQEPS